MSMGPMGIAGSAAGSHLAQSQGTEVNRAQQETSAQSRQLQATENAENAAGIGQTEQDEETSDRDADGRRLWERQEEQPSDSKGNGSGPDTDQVCRSKDATGQRGQHLDLHG